MYSYLHALKLGCLLFSVFFFLAITKHFTTTSKTYLHPTFLRCVCAYLALGAALPDSTIPLSHDSRLPLCPTSLQPIVTFGTAYHSPPRQSQQTKLWRRRTARKVPACTLLHPTLPPPRIPPHTMDKLGGWLGPSCVMTLVACPWMSASGFPELPSPQLMIKGLPSYAGCSCVPVFCPFFPARRALAKLGLASVISYTSFSPTLFVSYRYSSAAKLGILRRGGA